MVCIQLDQENMRDRLNNKHRFIYNHSQTEWLNLCVKFGNKCLCCGKSGIKLTKDHIVPISRGGENGIDNIQPLCQPCNVKKGNDSIDYRTGKLEFVGDANPISFNDVPSWYKLQLSLQYGKSCNHKIDNLEDRIKALSEVILDLKNKNFQLKGDVETYRSKISKKKESKQNEDKQVVSRIQYEKLLEKHNNLIISHEELKNSDKIIGRKKKEKRVAFHSQCCDEFMQSKGIFEEFEIYVKARFNNYYEQLNDI